MSDRPAPPPYLSLDACVRGRVYRLRSRHLAIGVFDGKRAFLGLRHKGVWRLDRELHWDADERHGTAQPLEELGELPAGVEIVERLALRDARSGRAVVFEARGDAPKRAWRYADTDEPDTTIEPEAAHNDPLFDWLVSLERRLGLRG